MELLLTLLTNLVVKEKPLKKGKTKLDINAQKSLSCNPLNLSKSLGFSVLILKVF